MLALYFPMQCLLSSLLSSSWKLCPSSSSLTPNKSNRWKRMHQHLWLLLFLVSNPLGTYRLGNRCHLIHPLLLLACRVLQPSLLCYHHLHTIDLAAAGGSVGFVRRRSHCVRFLATIAPWSIAMRRDIGKSRSYNSISLTCSSRWLTCCSYDPAKCNHPALHDLKFTGTHSTPLAYSHSRPHVFFEAHTSMLYQIMVRRLKLLSNFYIRGSQVGIHYLSNQSYVISK